MAAPPPPPPPPPPPSGPINTGKPDNKKLLDSICKGASLKKVPDSMKNDRSEVTLNKPQGSGNSKNNSGPLLPPSNKPMTLTEEINARKNKKVSQTAPQVSPIPPMSLNEKFSKPNIQQPPSQALPIPPCNKPLPFNDELTATKNQKPTIFQLPPQINSKRSGAPLPNSHPTQFVPPPPSASNKPISIAQPPAPLRMPSNLPPPPHPGFNSTVQPPPPPPPKDMKPTFRQPIPIRSKPTINDDSQIRGIQPNQFCGPIIPPPPPMLPPSNGVRPPRFGPPPPPPPSTMPNSLSKPDAPMRTDSGDKCDFDSRFTFLDMKYFPDPNTMIKMRQT